MDNLLTYIQNGGTHQQNPNGGVPIGKGASAEEGETMTKDYVFSDRIKLTDRVLKKHYLPKRYKGKTIADASKDINKMIEESNHVVDKETVTEMLERLKGANEELRPKTDLPSTEEHTANPDMQLPVKEMAGGGDPFNPWGIADKTAGGGGASFGAIASKGLGILGAAGTAYDFGNQIFGNDTGIDTSGAAMYDKDKTAVSALGNAGKGALAGMAFGPVGAIAGGLVGGITGLIGSGKRQDDIDEANFNYSLGINSKHRESDFMYGGKKKYYEHGGPHNKMSGYNFLANELGYTTPTPVSTSSAYTPQIDKVNATMQPLTEIDGLFQDKYKTAFDYNNDPMKNFVANPTNFQPSIATAKAESEDTPISRRADERKKKIGNTVDTAMRFAPVATNLLQYMNMKKPAYESFDRLDKKYKPDYVDEAGIVNQVKEQESTTRRALHNASAGDVGALRSNLLMSHLNSIKGRSQAFMQAENVNRDENRAGQQFNQRSDIYNLQQSNLETDVNARNQAAYDNNRSRFLSQIGQDIGNIGTENQRKKMAERMGLDYNWLGEFLKAKTG